MKNEKGVAIYYRTALMDGTIMFGSIFEDIQTVINQHYKKIHSEKIKQGIAHKKSEEEVSGKRLLNRV